MRRSNTRAVTRLARQPPAQHRQIVTLPRLFPQPPAQPYARSATTTTSNTDWLAWLKKASAFKTSSDERQGGTALLFAGLGSFPHTPHSPTPASLLVWEQASEALLTPDATIGYFPQNMEEFAGHLRGAVGIRGWMRGWVEGRSLDELMKRPDVTAAFILTSSVAILASEQERSGSKTWLPKGTTHLAGHGFIGTLTALVAAGRLDLATGVRLAMIYASLPPVPPGSEPLKFLTTVISARLFHSLSAPPTDVPFGEYSSDYAESSSAPGQRRRAMQLILDEVHALQNEWQERGPEWAAAGIINSSKVCVVTGTQQAVLQLIERLQHLSLANPVMDVHMPCPYHTKLMAHAVPKFRETLSRALFRNPDTFAAADLPQGTIILDPMTTHPMGPAATSLIPHLTDQLRWHKTLSRLYRPVAPEVTSFKTVGRGAKGLGVMLRGELRQRPEGAADIYVEEFGVKAVGSVLPRARL
ncbi:hypothetical protein BCR39DRAFT_523603 [Naematelia encephala]|uniref:[acyl-carrier-protein] S-malonyltransferase n=1 Tax=Naematelia encephala TaxID=71784 RepID=A0A1Y2BC17_9TREE|nr:hypothetical protein BCR39DRAFT_523603 [Naematelia encephala]